MGYEYFSFGTTNIPLYPKFLLRYHSYLRGDAKVFEKPLMRGPKQSHDDFELPVIKI